MNIPWIRRVLFWSLLRWCAAGTISDPSGNRTEEPGTWRIERPEVMALHGFLQVIYCCLWMECSMLVPLLLFRWGCCSSQKKLSDFRLKSGTFFARYWWFMTKNLTKSQLSTCSLKTWFMTFSFANLYQTLIRFCCCWDWKGRLIPTNRSILSESASGRGTEGRRSSAWLCSSFLVVWAFGMCICNDHTIINDI